MSRPPPTPKGRPPRSAVALNDRSSTMDRALQTYEQSHNLHALQHAVSPRRDDGFIGDLGTGRNGLHHNGRGSRGSRGCGSTLLRVALMLEVADSVGRSGVGCGVTVSGLMARWGRHICLRLPRLA
jgi:hypothetical protein